MKEVVMDLVKAMRKLSFLPPRRLLELYPPFLFIGLKVESASVDHQRLVVSVPLRWYGTNQYGSMFGGIVCAVSDPLPALMCSRIFKDHEIWTRKNCVEFLRPARGRIEAEVIVTDADLASIRDALSRHGKTSHTFHFSFKDARHNEIARVTNTVYLKRGGKPFGR